MGNGNETTSLEEQVAKQVQTILRKIEIGNEMVRKLRLGMTPDANRVTMTLQLTYDKPLSPAMAKLMASFVGDTLANHAGEMQAQAPEPRLEHVAVSFGPDLFRFDIPERGEEP
jgi:hypothetical protein